MAKITKEDVDHVKLLARLDIPQEDKMTAELETILEYVAEVEGAPTEGIAEIAQLSDLKNVTREDKITPSLDIKEVLQNAPAKENNFIRTRKVFE